MLKIRYHTSFKRDYKKIVKRGYDIKLLEDFPVADRKQPDLAAACPDGPAAALLDNGNFFGTDSFSCIPQFDDSHCFQCDPAG